MEDQLIDLDSKDPEYFNYTYEEFWKEQPDAKDFGPSWLDGIQGSLAEERLTSRNRLKKELTLQRRKLRPFLRGNSLLKFASDPESITIKLSECWARVPSASVSLDVNLQKATNSNSKQLRSFLIWYYFQDGISEEAKFLIEADLDRILDLGVYSNSKIHKENLIIRQSFLILETNQARDLIRTFYSSSNLERWSKRGKELAEKIQVITFRGSTPSEKKRKRGHRESHSNKHKAIDGRRVVNMDESTQSLEEIKQRILKKQALLFEQRLDRYLRLEDPDLPPDQKKKIYLSLLEPATSQEIEELEQRKVTLETINSINKTPKEEQENE